MSSDLGARKVMVFRNRRGISVKPELSILSGIGWQMGEIEESRFLWIILFSLV